MRGSTFRKIVGPGERDGACDAAFTVITKSLGTLINSVDRGSISAGAAEDQMSDCAQAFIELIDKRYPALSDEARTHIRDIVVKADRPWQEHRTNRQEAERRAASTRENRTFTWDPPPEDEEEEDETDEKGIQPMNAITEALAKGDKVTKADIHKAFVELAAALRNADPKLTAAQAFTKAYEDPANARLRSVYMSAPAAPPAAPARIAKRDEPTDLGWRCLKAKADDLRKVEPKLTAEQAFAKAYADPANSDYVRIHRAA